MKFKKKNTNIKVFEFRFKTLLKYLKKIGVIKDFDDRFYSQFDGMLYNMTPVDYYLKKMSMRRCYDASAVLGLAFGRNENVYVCRGNLKYAGLMFDGTTDFGHGWVEKDGFVYDTTWQIILPQKVYYKLFGVEIITKQTTNQFFAKCEHLSDYHIRDKKYYEENFSQFGYPTLIQLINVAEIFKKHPDPKECKIAQKLQNDLPDINKVHAQQKKEFELI